MLQKLSLVSAVLSFVLALAAGIVLYLRLPSMGIENPITASLMASVFFFISVGVILVVIGTTNLPSFKVDGSEGKDVEN